MQVSHGIHSMSCDCKCWATITDDFFRVESLQISNLSGLRVEVDVGQKSWCRNDDSTRRPDAAGVRI